MHHIAVHREGFHFAMSGEQDRTAWCLVHAAALHADETVLDHIDTANAMLAAELIQASPSLASGAKLLTVHRNTVACFKLKLDVFRLIRCIFWRNAQDVHAFVLVRCSDRTKDLPACRSRS